MEINDEAPLPETCETCPHWQPDIEDPTLEDALNAAGNAGDEYARAYAMKRFGLGCCHLNPPTYVADADGGDPCESASPNVWAYPATTGAADWCSHHPGRKELNGKPYQL